MPTLSAHVTDDMAKKARDEAAKRFKSRMSAYIAYLIEKDLTESKNFPAAQDEDALIKLAESFHPTKKKRIQAGADKYRLDQPDAVYQFLQSLCVRLDEMDGKPVKDPSDLFFFTAPLSYPKEVDLVELDQAAESPGEYSKQEATEFGIEKAKNDPQLKSLVKQASDKIDAKKKDRA